MKKEKKNRELIRLRTVWIVGAVLLLGVVIASGARVWKKYEKTLMDNQIEQLKMTAQILSENMESSFQEYEDGFEFLTGIETYSNSEELFQEYLDTQDGFVCDIFKADKEGNFQKSMKGKQYQNPLKLARMNEGSQVYQIEDENGCKYLMMKNGGKLTECLCIVIDEERYYNRIISGIRIGENGYIVIKNSEGKILMHPDSEQWGIDVIEGRKEMYPELDYSSLERMIEDQKSGEAGVSEYYSYWWTNPELPRVKKISAYAPVWLGNDFLVVSAVVDYNDLYVPIREGFTGLIKIFAVIILILFALFIGAAKLFMDKKMAESEIVYLKELNGLLEEVHQNEETIAHQQRLQIMGTMTGGIAHEFNNFLTPIMGYAELLMLELPEDSEEYDNVMEIYEASEKAKEVVRQISTLSRKNVETVYKEVPAQKMLQRAAKMVSSVCPQNIRLKSEFELDSEKIMGNATQINQVILNICVNAVHAIGKNEGDIDIYGRKIAYISIPEEIKGKLHDTWKNYIWIQISDTGCGMDSETLRQIFNPFFTTKKGGEGTGLGLALGEQIITSHRGYLYAESKVGEGSTFHIYLPVLEEAKQKEQFVACDKEGYQIIVADDNAKVLQLLKKEFSKIGIEIMVCMKQKEVLTFLEEQEPDVLFIDESLEDTSGIELCMSLVGKCPDMLKVIMTDHVTREIAEAKQRNVIQGYVEKPVSSTTLLQELRKCREERV